MAKRATSQITKTRPPASKPNSATKRVRLPGPPVKIAAPEEDPVLDAVERCYTAWEMFEKVCDLTDDIAYPNRTGDQKALAEKIWNCTVSAWEAEARRACRIRPTTLQGLVALIELIEAHVEHGEGILNKPVTTIAQAARALSKPQINGPGNHGVGRRRIP
jgi:hypothetical protein